MNQNQNDFFLSTTGSLPNFEIVQNLGIVFGVTVRSKGWTGEWSAGCQACKGGEITTYTNMVIEARNQALQRMISDAQSRGANAIIGMRFDSDQLGSQGGINAIVAMGTSVLVRKIS